MSKPSAESEIERLKRARDEARDRVGKCAELFDCRPSDVPAEVKALHQRCEEAGNSERKWMDRAFALQERCERLETALRDYASRCPDCAGVGWYMRDRGDGEPEQAQCQWCDAALTALAQPAQPSTETTP